MLVEFVEKGAGVEADVLANVVALLPPDLRDQLPEEVQSHTYLWFDFSSISAARPFYFFPDNACYIYALWKTFALSHGMQTMAIRHERNSSR